MSALIRLISIATFARCDLPVHTRLPEIVGDWDFKLLPLSQTGYSDADLPRNLIATCGSGLPNHNSDNLNPELQRRYLSWLSEGYGVDKQSERRLGINLSVENGPSASNAAGREKWKSLVAIETDASDDEDARGHWTMIYDEGFEIRLPQRKLTVTAFVKYTLEGGCRGSEDAAEAADGHTECYQTHPDETLLGWFEQGDRDSSRRVYGCVKGKKGRSNRSGSSLIDHRERSAVIDSKLKKSREPITPEQIKDQLRPKPLWKTSPSAFNNPAFEKIFRWYSTSAFIAAPPTASCRVQSSVDEKDDALPESYSVGDPFLSPDKMTDLDRVIVNQGACGSCYAISSAYVVQKKLEMAGHDLDSSLSISNLLGCSFYNQGCRGGYPYLVGKWAYQFGLSSDRCEGGQYMDRDADMCSLPVEPPHSNASSFPAVQSQEQLLYVSTGDSISKRNGPRKVRQAALLDRADHSACPRYRAAGYGYLGGCFGCSTELAMRRELYHHGPVVVALEAPASLVLYEDGIFDDEPRNHHTACTAIELENGVSGWEFTNHAIVLVGYGIEHVTKADENGTIEIPYWIARNSWGSHWGKDGYFKILRKVNLGGIENQPVFIDVK